MSSFDATLAINGGTPVRTTPLPGHNRQMGQEELDELAEVNSSGQLGRHGSTNVKELERAFAGLYGVKHAIAVTSGSAAVHTAGDAPHPRLDRRIEWQTNPISSLNSAAPTWRLGRSAGVSEPWAPSGCSLAAIFRSSLSHTCEPRTSMPNCRQMRLRVSVVELRCGYSQHCLKSAYRLEPWRNNTKGPRMSYR